ncbi:MAG: TVP38/TMEM64 family protein [Clostridium sp.]
MTLIYFLTCFIQPILLPTPEALTILSGSIAFGANTAFILGLIGTLLGTSTMYFISLKCSPKVVSKLVKDEQISRYKIMIKKHELLVTALLFILPFLPDEVVCIGSGLIGISYKTFFGIALFSKSITIALYAYSTELSSILNMGTLELIILELLILGIVYSLIRALQYLKEKLFRVEESHTPTKLL